MLRNIFIIIYSKFNIHIQNIEILKHTQSHTHVHVPSAYSVEHQLEQTKSEQVGKRYKEQDQEKED